MPKSPAVQLAGFIARFTPEVAALIKAARAKLRRRLPHALELVYDNYNFFVIGFGPTERPFDAVFSIAPHARGVLLCFLWGAKLPDPKKMLCGSGNQVRNISRSDAAMLDRPEVQTLITAAVNQARRPFDPATRHQLIIRAISAKQRPHRPVAAPSGKSAIGNRKP